ncbi:hypothetical protein PTQ19_07555 [Microbacterium esteraromaticum]|uniref:hypothetical protein n=1 Tax=Microbacterium esteraromaticum TaxID=57043 RepID=UPI0023682E2B|nr:hypothetical protein [Microbacterium esteraromaticum]WDH77407.1 hypothetical protein PTQ19_07555 [Microbacterium esteraromaticum]
MGDEDDSTPPAEQVANKPEPPYQALLPNLDKLSRSSFDKGTVSRRRINRALLVLALMPVVVLAVIFVPQLING